MKPADAALLIVDDNEDNRYTLTRRLQREGYANLLTLHLELEIKPIQKQTPRPILVGALVSMSYFGSGRRLFSTA